MLWMILTLMTVLAAVGLAIPLVRRRDAARAQRADAVTVLKDQLGEIETQAASGSLPQPEADALKSDLKRRVLAEGRQPEAAARPLSERTLLIAGLGIVAVVTLAGTGLYLKIGRPDVPGISALKGGAPAPGGPASMATDAEGHPQGEVGAMIAQLEAQMQQRPDNAEGWRMLGWSYMQTGRNAEAAGAYGKAAALDPKNAEYLSAQGEATVLAADGSVTSAAEDVFKRAVAADPGDPRARYYLAVAKDQRGDQEGAMNDWITLLKSAPPNAPWAPEVRTFVEKVAAERKIDLSGRLPPMQTAQAPMAPPTGAPPMGAAPRGPNQQQMADAQNMSDGDRQQMIQGMVSGLAERLKQNPKDRAGWERLIRARMVLGQTQQAAADYRDATRAFAGSPADQQALRAAAAQLGVPVS
ncbi:MAG: c-type cytochrome biogenesis protein CcmI [Alphaproteobacteria bacterium]|nr:c-type cytochrome biogenesis protein CcmI [Alphaproteobacteria bacterium]MBU1516473.1 c-type cytochrome biogenesis protein CcmI [Alphaproteobacteria bacterium]MBU2094230.1 c-type cytochrome biogenesis protein CcmI [Alphaproteobacteria bacterium]MBU2154193.1 c-type cytochrome biogenesis protein CcmI [Alphaproteobacteria bacterium]MBU2307400.1 c-type cytochrome biogenesis protein CcmI [Alphaproteobacteria bacterium]